jgi:hypothetical protein
MNWLVGTFLDEVGPALMVLALFAIWLVWAVTGILRSSVRVAMRRLRRRRTALRLSRPLAVTGACTLLLLLATFALTGSQVGAMRAVGREVAESRLEVSQDITRFVHQAHVFNRSPHGLPHRVPAGIAPWRALDPD